MNREDRFTIINLVFERRVNDAMSFLTIPIELRKEWVTHQLVTGIARTAKEFNNLTGWELGVYYYEQP
mgnify:CR=1 FL=1